MTKLHAILLVFCLAGLGNSFAQNPHGGMIRVANIYISPDFSSARLGEVDRGHEVVILDTSGDWVHVEALLTEEKAITGWIPNKGVVEASTPDGDKVLFGEAVESEDDASKPHGRRGAAQDAMRLYYRVYDIFPNSPLAGEALYRSADIRWQLEREDVMTLPSAKEREAYMRPAINDDLMKQVMKKFPGTKWADLAAFHLIENKLCGSWQGTSKCPEKEADMYERYVSDHPQSPAAAEALYDAAWRRSALIEIYKTEDNSKKSEESRAKAIALAERVVSQYPQGDWAARAQLLIYMIQQQIPTFGDQD
jgi:outer membrane protein assembly factor BamD (BamD/ComL family)